LAESLKQKLRQLQVSLAARTMSCQSMQMQLLLFQQRNKTRNKSWSWVYSIESTMNWMPVWRLRNEHQSWAGQWQDNVDTSVQANVI